MRALVIATWTLGWGLGCSTSSMDGAFKWTSEPSAKASHTRRTEFVSAEGLAEWAASHPSPQDCERAARYTIRASPKTALRRLRACARRPDFDVLVPLLYGRWLTMLRDAGVAGLDVIARTMARRPAELRQDIGSAQTAGIDLHALMTRGPIDGYVGRTVLAPTVVDATEPAVELSQMTYELPSYSEDQYDDIVNVSVYVLSFRGRRYVVPHVDIEKNGEAKYLQTWYATNRRLRFRPNPRCPVKKEETWLILAKVVDVRPAPFKGEADIVDLAVINCYPFKVALDAGGEPLE